MRKVFIISIISLLLPSLTWSKDTGYDPLQVRAEVYLDQALELYNALKFKEAIRLYKKAVDLKPDSPQVWYLLGRSYYRAGQMDQFFSAWDRFIRLSKEDTYEIQRKMEMYLEKPKEIPTKYEHLATIKGKDEIVFYNPTGIAIDSKDNFYISSFGSSAILKFSSTGNFLLQFGVKGKKEGRLDKPYGITVDEEDNIYITDSGNHRVQKFTSDGKFVMAFGKKGRKPGEFIDPKGIAVDEEGNIYVVDNGNSRIQVFSREGRFIGQMGKMGKEESELFHPIEIALDEEKGVWIIEEKGKYLKNFTTTGSFKNAFLFPQEKLVPQGITYLPNGKLYVVFLGGVIFRFDIETQRWEKIITPKPPILTPSALAVNKYGLLYVSDSDNHSVSILMPEGFKKTQFDVWVHRIDTSRYPTIMIPVMVTTQNKTPILGLTPSNFKIEEDKRWIRPITATTPVYSNEYCVITFIVDTSEEMIEYEDDVKKLLNKFIDDMKGGVQVVSIIGFCKNVKQIQPFTRNKTILRDEIEKLNFRGNRDKEIVFSAITLGIDNMNNLICKKAICLITSNNEVEEGTLFKECLYYAKNNGIPIFVVDYRLEGETKSMKNLATQTLGNYFLAYKSLESQELYKSITAQIKNQNIYLLSYQSPQEEWALEWTDITVSAGHKHLYAKDEVYYIVPKGKGMDKEIVEKIEERIEKKRLEEIAKKLEKEKKKAEEKKKKEKEKKAKKDKEKKGEEFPPPEDWTEGIPVDIGEPIREEKYVTDEEEEKKAKKKDKAGGKH